MNPSLRLAFVFVQHYMHRLATPNVACFFLQCLYNPAKLVWSFFRSSLLFPLGMLSAEYLSMLAATPCKTPFAHWGVESEDLVLEPKKKPSRLTHKSYISVDVSQDQVQGYWVAERPIYADQNDTNLRSKSLQCKCN